MIREKGFDSLRIDVSKDCNNNCIFCSDSNRQSMNTEEVKQVLNAKRELKKVVKVTYLLVSKTSKLFRVKNSPFICRGLPTCPT